MKTVLSKPRHSHTPILPHPHTARIAIAVLATLALCAVPALARGLTAKQILERAARPYDAIKDYTVNVRLSVESPEMHVPQMDLKVFFKKPHKIHVEGADSFALLPRQGLVMGNPPRDLLVGTDLTLSESQKVGGLMCYVVRGTTQRNGRSIDTTFWIDQKVFLIRQVWVNPELGSSVKAQLQYEKVVGRYWLPSSTSAKISLPRMPEFESKQKGGAATGVPTVVKIKFSNYKVNQGLSDKIFEQQQGVK
jgi:outer membrane lipoprotein-sorting protein